MIENLDNLRMSENLVAAFRTIPYMPDPVLLQHSYPREGAAFRQSVGIYGWRVTPTTRLTSATLLTTLLRVLSVTCASSTEVTYVRNVNASMTIFSARSLP